LSLMLLLRCCYYFFLLHCCQLVVVVVVGSSPLTFLSCSCWFIAFDTLVLVVGSSPSTISSRLLVHRLQQSRLGCWFTAFNNLVSVVGSPPSTISVLEALGVLSNISIIFTHCLCVSSWTYILYISSSLNGSVGYIM
jgi:hypothetical protein